MAASSDLSRRGLRIDAHAPCQMRNHSVPAGQTASASQSREKVFASRGSDTNSRALR